MFKLYRYFKTRDIIGVIAIVILTVVQVYFTMGIVDYTKGIIEAIGYVNYHNNPKELFEGFDLIVNNVGFDNLKNYDNAYLLLSPVVGNNSEVINVVVKIANASINDVWYNGLMMIAYAAFIMLTQGLISVIASYVAADLSTIVRTKVYKRVSEFSLSEINKFSTPSLITRCSNDIQQVQMANLMTMRMVFAAPVTAIWAIIKIQASSLELTISTVIAIVILISMIASIMIIAMPKFKAMQKLTDNLNLTTRENLTGVRIVRAFNAEEYQEEKFEKANVEFTKTQIFTAKAMSVMNPGMMIIMNLSSLAIYIIGANLINKGKIDYATISSFMMLSSQIIMSFVMLMMMFILVPRASVCGKRIMEVLETEVSIKDKEEVLPQISEGDIEFKNVSFKFPNGDDYALSNISFEIKRGKTLAIIGATGVGKTTLVNLILRMYDVNEGSVLVGGVDVKDQSIKDLRSKIGYVPQKAFLFKGSIKDNIALGSIDMPLDDIILASKVSCSYDFIMEKENNFDFEISQGGKNVSGGQRQRLSIARAIAKKPSIYIFDDSFSALDYKTDKVLRENLNSLNDNATKVIVAQRIGTILNADKILVLDEGKIVGEGTHQELLKNCSVYKEIALSQLSRKELGLDEEE